MSGSNSLWSTIISEIDSSYRLSACNGRSQCKRSLQAKSMASLIPNLSAIRRKMPSSIVQLLPVLTTWKNAPVAVVLFTYRQDWAKFDGTFSDIDASSLRVQGTGFSLELNLSSVSAELLPSGEAFVKVDRPSRQSNCLSLKSTEYGCVIFPFEVTAPSEPQK
jgi:hypothetical protein